MNEVAKRNADSVSDTFKSYGVRESTKLASETDRSVEEIRISGYSIVPAVLSGDELDIIRQKLEKTYAVQVAETGEEHLRAINDAHIVRLLLAYDEYFVG